jgi:[acyl-carrier-protein] S-malonyltransferase
MKTALILPGQGSQFIGMGRLLYRHSITSRRIFNTVQNITGINITKIIFGDSKKELDLTVNTQLAVFTISISLIKTLKEEADLDIVKNSQYIAGHSLGELTAYALSKTINLETIIKIVKYRSTIIQESVPVGVGRMAALIGMDYNAVQTLINKNNNICEIANCNSPSQIVISGLKEAVEEIAYKSIQEGAKKYMFLPISAPLHCSLMRQSEIKLKNKLENIEFREPLLPIISNVTASEEVNPRTLKSLLSKQISSKVKWEKSIERILKNGVTTFIEIGPSKTLSSIIKKYAKNVKIVSINTPNCISKIRIGL